MLCILFSTHRNVHSWTHVLFTIIGTRYYLIGLGSNVLCWILFHCPLYSAYSLFWIFKVICIIYRVRAKWGFSLNASNLWDLGGAISKFFSIAVLLIKPIFYPQIKELFLRFFVLVRRHLRTCIVLLFAQILKRFPIITPCNNYLHSSA